MRGTIPVLPKRPHGTPSCVPTLLPRWAGCVLATVSALLAGPVSVAALELDLRLDKAPAQPGAPVLVQITVSNTGTEAERDLQLRVPFPDGIDNLPTSLVAGGSNAPDSCKQIDSSGAECSPGETLIRTLETIGPFSTRVITFPVSLASGTEHGSAITLATELTALGESRAVSATTLGQPYRLVPVTPRDEWIRRWRMDLLLLLFLLLAGFISSLPRAGWPTGRGRGTRNWR